MFPLKVRKAKCSRMGDMSFGFEYKTVCFFVKTRERDGQHEVITEVFV